MITLSLSAQQVNRPSNVQNLPRFCQESGYDDQGLLRKLDLFAPGMFEDMKMLGEPGSMVAVCFWSRTNSCPPSGC